jgi:signal transduction histidine kinase
MMEMKLAPTDLAELVVQSINSVKTLAETNAVKIEVFGDHAIVSVDKERIMQVFINLLSNAIKYSPQGSTITVSVAMKQDSAHIKIEDQGQGIPRHMLESVFDRFQQAHGGGAGTSGLGLAICKAIVEAHGGKIGVVSEVGSGSMFWLHLPTSNPAT